MSNYIKFENLPLSAQNAIIENDRYLDEDGDTPTPHDQLTFWKDGESFYMQDPADCGISNVALVWNEEDANWE